MAKINMSFIAENASLQRDDAGNLIVIVQGVDEDHFAAAQQQYHVQVEANRIAAEREAKIRAEAEKIVAEQEAAAQAASEEPSNG